MLKTRNIKLAILLGSILGVIGIIVLYVLNPSSIVDSYNTQEGFIGVIGIITLRIIILLLMSLYMFIEWFKAERQFLSDIPFLFAFFFLVLIFGKSFDLLSNLIYNASTIEAFRLILKIRFIVAIIDLIPLYSLSIAVILNIPNLEERYKRLKSDKYKSKIKRFLLVFLFLVEFIVIILFLDENTGSVILPAIVIPTLVVIVLIFNFCYRNKILSQANSLILFISFIAYLLSQIIRPLMQRILGLTAFYIIIVEIIDLIVFMFIFLGLVKKPDYT